MLVLSRYEQEQIVITTADGTQIVVTLVRVDRNKVRVGIHAPDSVTINRAEIHQRIHGLPAPPAGGTTA